MTLRMVLRSATILGLATILRVAMFLLVLGFQLLRNIATFPRVVFLLRMSGFFELRIATEPRLTKILVEAELA